jgi:TatD DNase family protein
LSKTGEKMAIDTHTHISDFRFDADRDEVIKRAETAGVNKIFEILCEPEVWNKGLDLAKRENIFVSFGIHPHQAKDVKASDFTELEKNIKINKCIAVGETGLDYHYDLSPRNLQKKVFRKQVEIAKNNSLPLVIHCRNAYNDTIEILREFSLHHTGVIHSFDGSLEQAQIFIEMGFLLGICSVITFPKSDELKNVVSRIDISKLLSETDCPYRAPQKFRGKRSEPSYVVEIIKEIARIKNISFGAAEEITSQTAQKMFL